MTLVAIFSIIGLFAIVAITMREIQEAEIGAAVILLALLFLSICWRVVAGRRYNNSNANQRLAPRVDACSATRFSDRELTKAFNEFSPHWRDLTPPFGGLPEETGQNYQDYQENYQLERMAENENI